ncbi:hypothetical protein KFL_000010170 [Klebsormidium nitens]|uniref:Uncharacterized protein n=1 Tax=Klebsormidium nitens TaxID=105231 RepID=A0A0U9HLP8_KLENI|nr:hypothetical protein KFL_000010170 [Klebsormidium nitens]|eukprot:GAQ77568.1 hypothetical protein KFL_000010170 [Klebsormidium nitens]
MFCPGDPVPGDTLVTGAVKILCTEDPHLKAQRGANLVHLWRSGAIVVPYDAHNVASNVPDKPARDTTVRILAPGEGPKRGRGGSLSSRQALLHSLVHIESWAVDLSWDIIARFGPACAMPREFFDEFVKVADDEGRHFQALERRLRDIGSSYGAFPAHDGLWESASGTAGDLLARLAVEHCVHEARGLDVVPQTIARFRSGGDPETADLLEKTIYPEEITHCAVGVKWFTYLCKRDLESGHTNEAYRGNNRSVCRETTSAGEVSATGPAGIAAAGREELVGNHATSREGLTKSGGGFVPEVSPDGESVARGLEACTLTERHKCADTCQAEKASSLGPDTSGRPQAPLAPTGDSNSSRESQAGETGSVRAEKNVDGKGSTLQTRILGDETSQVAKGSGDGAVSGGSADVPSEAELRRFVVSKFHEVVRRHFRGPLKPPFNHWARAQAGFDEEWYLPLASPAT